MSDKKPVKVVKKVTEKPKEIKEIKRLPTSNYSTRSKITRTFPSSSISFGSDAQQNSFLRTNSSFMKYHNESSFAFDSPNAEEQPSRKEVQRRLKTEQFNSKLPTYNPKTANRSQIVFGDEKPFVKKPVSEFTSPSRIPPGGRSQIVFG